MAKKKLVGAPFGAMMLAASVSNWAHAQQAETPALRTVTVTGTPEASPQGKDAIQTRRTTIGKGEQDIRDIPQSITVMTEKLLDDVRLDSLKEALHYTAGITFAAAENGTDQDIRLRGFPIASTGDLLIDGMRDPSQYDRDTFNLDRIEVMRGSASMLFGHGSTGGVVNQVSKKPLLANQTDVVGTVGTGRYARTTGDFNIRTGETSALRINAMVNKADNDGAKIDKQGIAPSYGWGLGTPDEFNVGLFYLHNDNVPPSGIRYVNGTLAAVKAGSFYGTTADFADGEASYINGSWLHLFPDGSELRTQFRSGVFDRSTWGSTVAACSVTPTATGTCPTGAPAVSSLDASTFLRRSGLTPRKDRYQATYAQSDYSRSFDAFGGHHEWLAGVDAAWEQAHRFQNDGTALGTRPPTTVGTPDDGAVLVGTGHAPQWRNSSNYRATSYGVYAQDLVQVAPAWKLLGGLRYDHFAGDFEQLSYAAGAAGALTGTTSTHLSNSPWSYRAGVLYQPSASRSWHFSYGTSFNTSADSYQFVTPQNANTPPEKSRNIEVGAKLDWLKGKLSTRGALFRTDKYNERTTDADFAGDAFLLSGKRHSSGVELDVVGRITPRWEIYASYTWIPVAKIDALGSAQAASVGARVGLTPKQSGALWASYQATSQLRLAAGVHGASENRPLQGTTGAASTTARVPGYAVVDAMVEYKFTPEVFLQVNVNNVGNHAYGDQLYPAFTILGPQRQLLATLGLRY
ncbi:TonB-dependent siderophore receptor [Ramlibacter sp.]|uniref:TonB-dependent receptor n=1 Tax=Ramlibacter sp. TaxID=1917967 RepID=UPI00261E00BB|nr:TonB-dependent siderophore receptor [Ramlibacter sp.]MDB5955309.1 TonB-dependent siderophore receptor [Ramlibacter sp.]